MKTEWDEKRISDLFDAYDDYVEDMLGYQPLIAEILTRHGPEASFLDYGCGGGKVTRRLLEAGVGRVTGVDLSADMIAKCKAANLPRASFHVIDEAGDDIPDETFDVAIACFVWINTDTKAALQQIARNIFQRLKPGGRFYILDSNPRVAGVRFTTFQSGEAGHAYADGALRKVVLSVPGYDAPLELWDRHWELGTYQQVLGKTGFVGPTIYEATAEILDEHARKRLSGGEASYPPFMRLTALKPQVGEKGRSSLST